MTARLGAALLVAIAACAAPAQKPAARDAAIDARAAGDGEGDGADDPAGDGDGDGPGDGDAAGKGKKGTGAIAVKVLWPTASPVARASGGRNACGLPRRPAAVVHTLHGVADVIVTIAGIAEPAVAAPVELVVAGCRVSPRVAIAAGGAVTIASADERRHVATVARVGDPGQLGAAAEPAPVLAAALPVVGHAVAASIPTPSVARVSVDGGDPAWLVAAPHRFAAVTDATGAARFADVPPGTHPVVAWAPAANLVMKGEATVVAGRTAEVVLTLAP
jgi:hypothetical protein